MDESAIPYRRKEDALERGGGSSTANQIWIAGAVETVGNHGVGRIRLARIAGRAAQSIVPFVVANTLPGAALQTDSLASYDKVPGRRLRRGNLSNRTMPARIVFKWIHVVFANLKRWALAHSMASGKKQLDAYLGEFAFRWNRRRHFHSAMDTMLGIGQRLEPVTYRGIVGDTTQWKKEHIGEILKMCHPNKRIIVEDLASYYRVHRMKVLEELTWWVGRLKEEDPDANGGFQWDFDGVREFDERRHCTRRKAEGPVLALRRPGEERLTGRR
ncbi:transposase [Mesorhizobium sp. M0166]